MKLQGWWSKGPPQRGNYDIYVFTKKESILYVTLAISLILIIANIFYDSMWAVPFLSPIIYLFLKEKEKEHRKQRCQELEKAFGDVLVSVEASLRTGMSVENSFVHAIKDMELLYGKDTDIVFELKQLQQRLTINMPIEKIILDLGKRSKCEDILEFSQVFQIAKKSGADMKAVLENTIYAIEEKMSVRKELEIVLAQKKLEQRIMSIMPIMIMVYISITSSGFFEVMYHNFIGVMVMTLCLIGYVIAYLIMRRMMDIHM